MSSALTLEHLALTGDVSVPNEVQGVLVHEPSNGRHSASVEEGFEFALFSEVRLVDGGRSIARGPGETFFTPYRIVGVMPEERESGSSWGDCTVHVWEAKYAQVEALVAPTSGRLRKKHRDLFVHLGSALFGLIELHEVVAGRQPRRLADARPVATSILHLIGSWNPAMSVAAIEEDASGWAAARADLA